MIQAHQLELVYFHNACRTALEANRFDPELIQLCTDMADTGKVLVEAVLMARFFTFVALLSLSHPKSRAPLRKSPLNLAGLSLRAFWFMP